MDSIKGQNKPRVSRLSYPVFAGALFVAVFAAYAYALGSGYIWDDDAHVLMDPARWGLSGLWNVWFTRTTQQYYPIVYSSFWAEANIWGAAPALSHAVNVALHAANAALVTLVLRRLGIKGAYLAGAVFALHPVHVESVAWISERKNVLSALFYLLALLSFIDSEEGKKKGLYAASLLFFLLALLSKTVACTLPAIFVIIRWMKGERITPRFIALTVPYFALGLAFGLVTVWWEANLVGARGESWSLGHLDRLVLSGRAAWFYLYKLVWPMEFIFIYPRWQIDASEAWQWSYAAALAAVGGALLYRSRSIGRQAFAAFAFFIVTLSPALGFIDVYPFRFSFVADHFQYLASVGPIAVFSALSARIPDGLLRGRESVMARAVPAVALVAVLAGLWSQTFRQTFIYEDSETLWNDTVRKNPGAWIAHNNLGNMYLERNDIARARQYILKAYELSPESPEINQNLGFLYFKISNLYTAEGSHGEATRYNDDAIRHYLAVLKARPGHVKALVNLGVALVKKGSYDEAISRYRMALALEPGNRVIYGNIEIAERLKAEAGL